MVGTIIDGWLIVTRFELISGDVLLIGARDGKERHIIVPPGGQPHFE